jgi:ABC-type multidrug transport system ATPase subunit
VGSGLRCSGGSVYDATGDVRYNGSVPSPTTVRQAVGYVQQQDFLLVRTQSCGRDRAITLPV